MAIRFTKSASRHGISRERARYVVEHCPLPAYSEGPVEGEVKALFLWSDRNGVPLEVGAIEFGSGDLLVVHAMRMRRKYLKEYETMIS